ncbi:UNVERIFIED_CONTAM: acetolactate synthase-1/2/3 large subunit [Williamsia faeni]
MTNPKVAGATVADVIIRRLSALGVDRIFGVHGANIEDLYAAALAGSGVKPVVAKHEFSAGTMADGAARITGRPAAVMTTSGGGAMNVVAALAESYDSRVPVLALIGSAPSALEGHGGFQDMLDPPDTIDARRIFSAVTGLCMKIDAPQQIYAALDAAERMLATNRPVALIIPKDIQTAAVADRTRLRCVRDVRVTSMAELEEVAAMMSDARGAVTVLAGEEASRQQVGADLAELVTAADGVLAATPGGRDLLGAGVPTVGLTGVMGHPSAASAVAASAVLLVVGSRLSLTDRAGLDTSDTIVIHIGAESPTIDVDTHVGVTDLRWAIQVITKNIDTERSAARRLVPGIEALPTPARLYPGGAGLLTSIQVIQTIGDRIPEGTNIFADAGNVGAAAIHHLPVGRDGRFVVALGMGGMGYAFGAAIGAALVTGQRSVVLAGDGAFLMHGMEIHTAIEHRLPVTVVLFNNNAHGMCVTREQLFFPGTPSVNRFRPTDFEAGLLAMFPGLTVSGARSRTDLVTATDHAFSGDGPHCLVVQTDPDELPPFGPFLSAHRSIEENR